MRGSRPKKRVRKRCVVCERRYEAHECVGIRQRTCGATCREEDRRRQRRRRRRRREARARERERERQRRHRARVLEGRGAAEASGQGGGVSRPQLARQVTVRRGDEGGKLAAKVRVLGAQLQRVTRVVEELAGRSGSG